MQKCLLQCILKNAFNDLKRKQEYNYKFIYFYFVNIINTKFIR